MNRRMFLRHISLMSVSLSTGAFPLLRSAHSDEREKLVLNVGYFSTADHLLLPVSHHLFGNDYKRLRVRPYLCLSWDDILAKIEMGVLQAAFLTTPLAMHRAEESKSMGCVLFGHRNGSVIASGTAVKNTHDLKGKKIGVPHPHSTHKLLLYKFLKDRQMELDKDVHLVKVPPALTVKYLKAGKISGYSISEPWGISGVNEGVAKILEYSKNILPHHVCCIIMIAKKIIDQQPEAVAEWVESLLLAGEYIHTRPREAAGIQLEYMKLNPLEVEQVITSDQISYRELSPRLEELARVRDLALEAGILEKRCNLDEFVDLRFTG